MRPVLSMTKVRSARLAWGSFPQLLGAGAAGQGRFRIGALVREAQKVEVCELRDY